MVGGVPHPGVEDLDMKYIGPFEIDKPDSDHTDLLGVLAEQGLVVRSDCGGRGLCGKCAVLLHTSDNVSAVTDGEKTALSAADLDAGYRLACQAHLTGKVSVSIPEGSCESREAPGKTDSRGTFPVDPTVRRVSITPSLVSDQKNRDIVSCLGNALGDHQFSQNVDSSVLADLSFSWFDQGVLTLVTHCRKGVTRILQGQKCRSIGVAVDIGTTTIAAYLCDLTSGEIMTSAGCANPQRRHGEDVISRINHASQHGDGIHALKELVTQEINWLIDECVHKVGAERWDVDELVVVGNTTMQHLFCGMNPHSLGRSPYKPITVSATDWKALDLDIDVHPYTDVHVFPVISGFVGGDTIAAVISQNMDLLSGVTMLVDIGTNGEVVLSRDGELWATSCATGPALEGAHISSGMRAVSGAIEKLWIDPLDLKVDYALLGQENGIKPRGICGSGIIDAVAGMRRSGIILTNGRLNESLPGVGLDSQNIGRTFTLVEADSAANARPIQITLQDVRQIQVAKAALAAGIRLLMQSAGVDCVDRLILTGAFGARFDWKNARSIGMLPSCCVTGTVQTVENAAGLGAVMALLDKNCRERAIQISDKTMVLELAEHPQFSTEFLLAVDFPELNEVLPMSVYP